MSLSKMLKILNLLDLHEEECSIHQVQSATEKATVPQAKPKPTRSITPAAAKRSATSNCGNVASAAADLEDEENVQRQHLCHERSQHQHMDNPSKQLFSGVVTPLTQV